MTRELFVSSTPHETKVGMVEDDLLAEIYLERENEYTLAGSIYKGRVTRVLPGMQSAFVDIGLERDAFLYVSDFMELEDAEDFDDVPTNRPRRAPPGASLSPKRMTAMHWPLRQRQNHNRQEGAEAGAEKREAAAPGESRDNRGGMRGRRRRRGRRGERMPESKFARPAEKRRVRLRGPNGQNAPTVPNVVSAQAVPSPPNEAGRFERPSEQSGQSVPNTDRLRDTSPLFCRESRSPNIQRLAQPRLHEAGTACATGPGTAGSGRLRKFLPTMSPFLRRQPFLCGGTKTAGGRTVVAARRRRLKTRNQRTGTANNSALHQMNVAAVFGGEAADVSEDESEDRDC